LLAICAFALSLLGTFLVRSGVLTSVHAFATDPARGIFILFFLGIVIGGSLTLYAWRAPHVLGGSAFGVVSRESFLLTNNVLLLVAMATILLGTLYPLVIDALGLGKLSVGPPYFNTVFVPIMALLATVLGLGPLTRWRRDELVRLWQQLRYAVLGAVVIGVSVFAALGEANGIKVGLGVALAMWIVLGTLQNLRSRLIQRRSIWASLSSQPRGFYGMSLAHMGLATVIVGVMVSSLYSTEIDRSLVPGETVEVGGYTFLFEGVREFTGPNFQASEGELRVFKDGKPVTILRPQKRIYQVRSSPMTEAAIDPGLTRDLYVSLGDPLDDGGWTLRLYHKPFVRWIWLGAIFMALGGLLAATDPRYRLATRRREGALQDALAGKAMAAGKP
jgi:cytochrome c-type biogenesis protein CcmF